MGTQSHGSAFSWTDRQTAEAFYVRQSVFLITASIMAVKNSVFIVK
jgi:hypothetical protein